MTKKDSSLSEFMSFWEVSEDLVEAAAQLNPAKTAPKLNFKTAITKLSETEKSTYLLRFAEDDPMVKPELIKHLQLLSGKLSPTHAMPELTLQNLLDLQAKLHTDRINAEKEAALAKRQAELEKMIPSEPQMWQQALEFLAMKRVAGYDKGVAILVDLKALSVLLGTVQVFRDKLQAIRTSYPSKVLNDRLIQAKLW
jgi:hypothetical protein